jgi:hypothetical protein
VQTTRHAAEDDKAWCVTKVTSLLLRVGEPQTATSQFFLMS